jgi:hypothetical protein
MVSVVRYHEIREIRDTTRRRYLTEERECLGWGVFMLRPCDPAKAAARPT